MNISSLPTHLAERCVVHGHAEIDGSGEFVLYWAHHALRADENPALQSAAALALKLELPLLVYQGLGGRHRYNADRHHGLARYHELRDDSALSEAVSRMSPYLHYGCVSVFSIAGDASRKGGEGAHKFLDELLVWRELSHHFCFNSEQLETPDILPHWASESLLAHEADLRQITFDWETLARAKTGNARLHVMQSGLI